MHTRCSMLIRVNTKNCKATNFKHNLKSKCQAKSVTITKQLTYDQTKETNRIKKKIEIIKKIADFFLKFCNAITDVIFFLLF